MVIVKYETEDERVQIITEKELNGYVLVAVSNVTEGNFLGFKSPEHVLADMNRQDLVTEISRLNDEIIQAKADNDMLKVMVADLGLMVGSGL